MNTSPNGYKYLAPNPKSNYRQLFIKGKRIRALVVYNMLGWGNESRTPEEVARDMGLPLEAVQEAIQYIESKPLEVDLDFKAEELSMELSGMNDPNYKYNPKPKSLTPEDRERIRRIYDALPG